MRDDESEPEVTDEQKYEELVARKQDRRAVSSYLFNILFVHIGRNTIRFLREASKVTNERSSGVTPSEYLQ